MKNIGVLELQGNYALHHKIFSDLGISSKGIKLSKDLDNVDAAKASSVFSGRDTIASSHDNAENATVLNVTLRATNDLPVVTNISQAASYHQGGDHILIASEALISDIDTTNFAGGAVKAELAAAKAESILGWTAGPTHLAYCCPGRGRARGRSRRRPPPTLSSARPGCTVFAARAGLPTNSSRRTWTKSQPTSP